MLTQKMMPGSEFTTVYPVLYPPYADRAAWAALPGAARWKAAGDAALQDADTLPRLPLSLWLRFTQNGDRTVWEHAYFARRRTLCALVMAEAVTGAGSYLPAIADLAWAICEESAWQLPAHNSYIRDTPQLPLPDVTRPIVDLFAAETGALIATVYGLLGAALDGYAPGFSVRLKGEVEHRVLAPYRTAHFWWMGNGEEPMCNWTPWCTQNVLLAAAQCAPAETLPVYVKQAAYSIDCFLKDYGEDGCCSEGAQYYRHAALTMFNALDLLCRIAPGVFDDVWTEPKIRNMAEYIVNMHIAGPYYLNFADCSPLAGARGVREFLFGQRVASAPLMTLAARDVAVSDALDAITMDIAPAYGAVPGLGFYRRRVQLSANGLTLQEETDYPGTTALTLMSAEKPTIVGHNVQFGALATAHINGTVRIAAEAVSITDSRLRQAWPDTLYRTRVYFRSTLTVEVR